MNNRGSDPKSTVAYKILKRSDWEEARRAGSYTGSADDVRDGFIHLSAARQLAGTAARHFRGMDNLVLVALDAEKLGALLRWEPSRNGDLFPHYHGPLPVSAAIWVKPLASGPGNVPLMPEEVA